MYKEELAQLFDDVFKKLVLEITPILNPTKEGHFGDLQCNNIFQCAKLLKCSPEDSARRIIEVVNGDSRAGRLIEKVIFSPPGFINIALKDQKLLEEINSVIEDKDLGIKKAVTPDRVIVEYSSPNIAKEMHVGHLRSTIIGHTLGNILEVLGFDVLRLNHIGDFGTQFGMLITYMKKLYGENPLSHIHGQKLEALTKWYREAKVCFDEDENFKEASRLEVVNLQKGEKLATSIWNEICEISRKGYREIYDLLNIKGLQERGESFYQALLPEVVSDCEERSLLKESDGANCVFLGDQFKSKSGSELPIMIQKSDGGYNYATTDIAAFKYRFSKDKVERIIIATDIGQELHFKMVFALACKLGFSENKRFDHVQFGLVLGKDKKKFKTRSGDTEKLIDLLREAIKRAEIILQKRQYQDSTLFANQEELRQAAEILGVGAVKYADLSNNRIKNYVFDYDKMLSFEGNTAPYIMYAVVRINSVLKRGCFSTFSKVTLTEDDPIKREEERMLILLLLNFSDVLHTIANDLMPNRLTDYLYELAEAFHRFYTRCPIIGSKEESSRLTLCFQVQAVLTKGLGILGIATLQKM